MMKTANILFAVLVVVLVQTNAVPFYGDLLHSLTRPSMHGFMEPPPSFARFNPQPQASNGFANIWPQQFANPSILPGYSNFDGDTEFVPLEQQGRNDNPNLKEEKPFDVDVITTDVGGNNRPGSVFFQQSFPFFGQDFFNSFGGFGIGGGPAAEPWWKGPNVCVEKTEDESDSDKDTKEPAAGDAEGAETSDIRPPLFGQFHFSVNSCVEKPNKYECTKLVKQNGKRKSLTTVRQCCHGYGRKPNAEYTSPCEKIDIKSLEDTASGMAAKDFIIGTKSNGVNDILANNKKLTIFLPLDRAFKAYNIQLRSESNLVDSMSNEDVRKLFERHTVDREVSLYDVLNEAIIKSLDGQTIRLNSYQMPLSLSLEPMRYTANCVPIVQHDVLSEQGMVHSLNGVLEPVDKNVMDIIRQRPDLSIMRTVLEKTKLNELLEGEKPVTIFVPTDAAFDKLEPQFRRALKEGKGCASNILKNHILDLTLCSAASIPGAKTTAYNLLGEVMRFNRSSSAKSQNSEVTDLIGKQVAEIHSDNNDDDDESPVMINGISKIIESDIMGLNGVIHIVDTILPTESALPLTSLMKDKNVTLFTQLLEAAGLDEKLNDMSNVTVFAPTDKALNYSKWAKLLKESPEALRNNAELTEMINNHIVNPSIKTCDLTEKLLPTVAGNNVRVNLYSTHSLFTNVMNRATVNCARLVQFDDESCDSVLHQVDKVLENPKMNLLELLESNPDYSKFLELVRSVKLTSILTNLDDSYTLLVPKNDVFGEVEEWEDTLRKDKNELENLIKTHIVNDVVCCAGIIPTNWPFVRTIESLNGAHLRISRDRRPKVENAGITKCDSIATNGIIHEINDVILPRRQNRPTQTNFHNNFDQLDGLFF